MLVSTYVAIASDVLSQDLLFKTILASHKFRHNYILADLNIQ